MRNNNAKKYLWGPTGLPLDNAVIVWYNILLEIIMPNIKRLSLLLSFLLFLPSIFAGKFAFILDTASTAATDAVAASPTAHGSGSGATFQLHTDLFAKILVF